MGAFHNRIYQRLEFWVQGDKYDDYYETNNLGFLTSVQTVIIIMKQIDPILFISLNLSANLIQLPVGWLWRPFLHHGSQGSWPLSIFLFNRFAMYLKVVAFFMRNDAPDFYIQGALSILLSFGLP